MSRAYMDAKISNFIHRKLATMGESVTRATRTTDTSGINYELLVLPKSGKDAK